MVEGAFFFFINSFPLEAKQIRVLVVRGEQILSVTCAVNQQVLIITPLINTQLGAIPFLQGLSLNSSLVFSTAVILTFISPNP